ncbi:MAG: serine/threonine protein kinase [Gemmatimonadales bacterium]
MKTCTTCGAEWPDDTKFCPNDGTTLRSAQAGETLIGSVVADRYHITKKLGEGGMGAVYLGEHVKMGRKSAIKVMTQALSQDAEAIARFNREAANAARINHPNVCGIYDFGETPDGTIYLAMEFIEGEALTDLLKREGPLGLHRATAILRQTADALQAAHDLGIVHRDLKPDNIMIARGRNDSDVVKVVDFGIAKAMGGEEGQKVTRTGLVVGTPEYMSPEQLSGDVMDGRSDVYSLALVFFKMLTGVLPFQAESAQEVMIKRLTDEPTKLADALPGGRFPPRLQEILDHALERMPGDRFESADAFSSAVIKSLNEPAAILDDKTEEVEVAATEIMDPEAVAATELIEKTVASEALAAVAPDTGSGVTSASVPPTPETPLPQASATTTGTKKKPVAAIAASVLVLAVGGGAAAVALMGGGGTLADPAGVKDSAITVARGSVATPASNGRRNPSNGSQDGRRGSENAGDGGAIKGRGVNIPLDTGDVRPSEGNTVDTGSSANKRVGDSPEVVARRLQAAIDTIIETILEDSTRDQARTRAKALYNGPAGTDRQKGQLAFMLASSYFLDDDNEPAACLWIDRALALDPDKPNYRAFKRDNCNQ